MKCPSGKFLAIVAIAGAFSFGSMNAQGPKLKKSVFSGGGHQKSLFGAGNQASGTFGQFVIGNGTFGATPQNKVWSGFWPDPNFIVHVEDGNQNASVSGLLNFPNPFNGLTTVRYNLPGDASVSAKIYDATGALVKVLFSGMQSKGQQELAWDAKSDNGIDYASGSYMMILSANPANMVGGDAFVGFNERIVMVLVK